MCLASIEYARHIGASGMTILRGKFENDARLSFEHLFASQDTRSQNGIPTLVDDRESVRACSAQTVVQDILLALKELRNGSVEILIHDSKVVQIKRSETHDLTVTNSIRSDEMRS